MRQTNSCHFDIYCDYLRIILDSSQFRIVEIQQRSL